MACCRPEEIAFSVLLGVEAPDILIKRDGSLRTQVPMITQKYVNVLLQGGHKGGLTRAQCDAISRLSRVVLHQNPFARIVFEAGASPWSLDCLPGYDERRTTTIEAIRIPSVRIRKVLLRRKPSHPAIAQRRAKPPRMP